MTSTSSPKLSAWWKARGYDPVPFEITQSRAEDERIDLLRNWYWPPLWPRDQQRTATTILDAIIALGQSGVVIIWGGRGTGKTFHRKLAAQTVQDEQLGARSLEVSFKDLCDAEVMKESGPMACQIARCVCQKIAASLHLQDPTQSTEPKTDEMYSSVTTKEQTTLSCPDEENLGKILSACGKLAERAVEKFGNQKVYVFLDGLDEVYYNWRGEKEAPCNAIQEFITFVASRACGEHLAVRVFLNTALKQQLGSLLALPIPSVELYWDSKSVEGLAEWRLRQTWIGQGQPPGHHLSALLDARAYELFRNDLKKRETEGTLSPRYVIQTLSSVVYYAIDHFVGTEPISDKMYRDALPVSRPKPPVTPLPPKGFRSGLRAIRLATGRHLKRLGSSVVRAVTHVITRLANFLDKAEANFKAILVVGVLLAVVIFLAWCLGRSYLAGQSTDVAECLRHVWQFLRELLPWTP